MEMYDVTLINTVSGSKLIEPKFDNFEDLYNKELKFVRNNPQWKTDIHFANHLICSFYWDEKGLKIKNFNTVDVVAKKIRENK